MPGKLKVKILAGRNLPVMDRSGDTTDAYVELKFNNITYKTDVCRKSLNPQWNSEWYKFEVDDAELQDEPLQIRLMDHDTYSANDAIGKVYLNLNPLLLPGSPPFLKNINNVDPSLSNFGLQGGSVMMGWIPVYDTMHGIRGEVNIIVKVELFIDFNKFKQSSCGVQFFYSPNIPHGYHAQVIHGFVEELIVTDDPEYKWIDKIRTPRASNEARQTLFFKLSGEVQRKIGLKALDLGGNAVIGYQQNFDLEGESGIVGRGIGTAVTLVKLHDYSSSVDGLPTEDMALICSNSKPQFDFSDLDNSYSMLLLPPRSPKNGNPLSLPLPKLSKQFYNCEKHFSNHFKKTRVKLVQHVPCNKRKRNLMNRHMSIQSFASMKASKNEDSSPSLSDYMLDDMHFKYVHDSDSVIEESPKHRKFFSPSLKRRLKNLPRSVLSGKKKTRHRKIKIMTDSFDEESDIDSSTYSSSWSIGGSETVSKRSTIKSYQPIKYKRFMHHKTCKTDSLMAMSLIKSLHSSQLTPLDSVKEDRETSTPSPIKFLLTGAKDTKDSSVRQLKNFNEKIVGSDQLLIENQCIETSSIANKGNRIIPMISSSETDTSTSDMDQDNDNYDDDDALRSKTDYNIFDDTSSLLESDTRDAVISDIIPTNIDNTTALLLNKEKSFFETKINPLTLLNTENLLDPENIVKSNKIYKSIRDFGDESCSDSSENFLNHVLFTATDEREETAIVKPKSKSLRKIKRKDTVIYKKRQHVQKLDKQVDVNLEVRNNMSLMAAQSLPTISIIIEPPPLENPTTSSIECKDVTNKEMQFNNSIEIALAMRHRYRKQCILDLINVIDTKMMNSVTDSLKKDNYSSCNIIPSIPTVHAHEISSLVDITQSYNLPYHSFTESLCKRVDFPERSQNLYGPNSVPPVVKKTNFPIIVTSVDELLNNVKLHKLAVNTLTSNMQSTVSNGNIEKSVDIELCETKLESGTSLNTQVFIARNTMCNLREKAQNKLVSAEPTNVTNITDNLCVPHTFPVLRQDQEEIAASSPTCPPPPSPPIQAQTKSTRSSTATKSNIATIPITRRSSDSDLSISAKGGSLPTTDKFKEKETNLKPLVPLVKTLTADTKPTTAIVRTMHQEAVEMLEYPFITMQQYPPGFVLHIGGLVSARSVKLLERVNSLEEPEGRDFWWTEIRMEVRSHARSLGCNVVLGYREDISICDDVCVLNASGTAAVINMHNTNSEQDVNRSQQCSVDSDRDKAPQKVIPASTKITEKQDSSDSAQSYITRANRKSESNDYEATVNINTCSLCHLPYHHENGVPFHMSTSKCAICRRGKVPDVLFATIELPENMPVTGRGTFIQAIVCKCKKDLRGELYAKEISDLLPFLEYELHSLLYNKLRVKGMNSIFGLKVQVSIGEKLMVAMAVGTAVYLTALPEPSVPHIASGNSWQDEAKLIELRKSLAETARKNREFYQLKSLSTDTDNSKSLNTSDTEESEEDVAELDVACGSKDVCVLEVDDCEDMERINVLIDDRPPDDFHLVNMQTIPGLEDQEIVRNLQMFTQVTRTKMPMQPFNATLPSKYLQQLLQTICFKLRRMVPCALCGLHFKVALPDQDEIQLSVVGMALGLGEPTKLDKIAEKNVTPSTSKDQMKKSDDSDMIFSLEEDFSDEVLASLQQSTSLSCSSQPSGFVASLLHRARPRSPSRLKSHTLLLPKHVPIKERYGVDITPLSYLPSGKIERYLGNLNFFLIRESTSIREQSGGLSGFTHSFVTEILAIVRAHITALGGNGMVSFFMSHCILSHSAHKNQGQCLINVGGDVVSVSYFGNDRQQQPSNC